MINQLIHQVDALSDHHKRQLKTLYNSLFTDASILERDISDLHAAFPHAVCEDGAVQAFFGLDRRPCRHQLTINGSQRYTWCIWDAFFIAETLGADAEVTTTDPMTNAPLSAQCRARSWQMNPKYWVSFPGKQVGGDLRRAFCQFVHLFSDQDSALRYQQIHNCQIDPVSKLLTHSQAMAIAMQPSTERLPAAALF